MRDVKRLGASFKELAALCASGFYVLDLGLGGIHQHPGHLCNGAGALYVHGVIAVAQVGQCVQQALAYLGDVRCCHSLRSG